jgi:hypothetical protein
MAQQKSVDTKVNGIAEPVDLEKGLVAGLLDLQSDSLAVFLADTCDRWYILSSLIVAQS